MTESHSIPAAKADLKNKPRPRDISSLPQRFLGLLGAHGIREALQTLFLVYLARTYTATYGEFILALSLGFMVAAFNELGLNRRLTTLLAHQKENAPAFLWQATVIKASLLALSLPALLAFAWWQGYSARLTAVAAIITLGIGLDTLAGSFLVDMQVRGRQPVEAKIRSLAAVAGLGYGLAAVYFGAPAAAIACYKPLEGTIMLAGSARMSRWRAGLCAGIGLLKGMWPVWRGGLQFTIISLAAILFNRINMLFLQAASGAQAVAQYGAAWQIADGLSIIISGILLRDVLFPQLVSRAADDPDELARLGRRAFGWLVMLSLPVAFILIVEGRWLLTLAFGPGYEKSAGLMPFLAPMVGLAFILNLCAYLMIAMGGVRALTWFYLAGLAFSLVCCGLLVPYRPLEGAAAAILLTKALVALLTTVYCQKRLRIMDKSWLGPIALASAAGLALYKLGMSLLPAPAPEALALVPMGLLAWARKKH